MPDLDQTNHRMKSVIIFPRLELKTLPIAFFFRALGWRVIFVEPFGTIRNNLWIERLERFGLEWVDYLSYPNFSSDGEFKITAIYSEALFDKAFQQQDVSLLCKISPALADNIQMARSLLFNHFHTSILPRSTAYALAEYFISQGHSAYIYQKRTRLTNLLNRFGITTVKNLCPFSQGLGLLQFFFQKLKALIKPTQRQAQVHPKTTCHSSKIEPQVLYFPHHGLEYGKLYRKDNYYSSDPQSPFHQNNIRHLEITALTPTSARQTIIDSYQRAGVAVEFLDIINIGIKDSLALLVRMIKETWRRKSCISISIELMISVQRVNSYAQSFQSLAGAKLALLGHDYLFPAAALVALKSMGIKTIAIQERFINAYYLGHAPVLDIYFVHGELIAQKYKKHAFALINSIIVSGDPRVQKILDSKEKSLRERERLYPEYNSVCLALDFHSTKDPFSNSLNPTNHWISNALFYQAIVNLARNNPDCLFIIRGKDGVWLDVSEMQNSLQLIAKQSNIVIDLQYDEFDRSYALAAMSDIIVARHNSLCDQSIAADIPVLIYDELPNGGTIMSELIDYKPYPVYCHSQEKLLSRFRETLDGDTYMPTGKFLEMRRLYYAISTDNKIGNVKGFIDSALTEALENS